MEIVETLQRYRTIIMETEEMRYKKYGIEIDTGWWVQ